MRARGTLFLCSLMVAIGLISGFFAPFGVADAQEVMGRECSSPAAIPTPSAGSLTSNGGHILTRDGTGFFAGDLGSVAVRSLGSTDTSVATATEAVAQKLTDFYSSSDVEVIVDVPGPSTRAVVIDGDVAVPGHPTMFSLGGVQTLYLHWTTASTDIEILLDTPAFTTLAAADWCGANARDALPPPAPPLAVPPLAEEPNDVLAYVNADPDTAQPASTVEELLRTPLADTSPTQQWPFPVAAAALVVTAGGLAFHQRDKIWGDRTAPAHEPTDALITVRKPALPIADLPPARPREIFVGDEEVGSTAAAAAATAAAFAPVVRADADPIPASLTPATLSPATLVPMRNRRIDLHGGQVESPPEHSAERFSSNAYGVVVTRQEFARHVNSEWDRHQRGGNDGAVASLVLSELDAVRRRLGHDAAAQLLDQVADLVAAITRSLDVIGHTNKNELAILMRNVDETRATSALERITKKIAGTTFVILGERVLLTPATGFALLSDTQSAPDLIRAVEHARSLSMLNLHLDPERWGSTQETPHAPAGKTSNVWANLKTKLRTPVQILVTIVLAWILPFFFYVGMAALGFDITFLVYLFLVMSLVMTGAFILAEGWMAIDQKEPPELEPSEFPKATALIAAYMPNEAETVIETIEAFLALDYPNDLQIILAYNTPDPMPVEEHLDRIAAEHPNFVPVRIVGSTSKAQNVNAALSMATGKFIGMFDADHQPRPDAFTRAWRWIDDGYDVVQGHCLTRNGDECFLAKMIAVEFESIYAVAHPGRAKMHRFGVFGGSNGFWRTELLHETRMRGSMLTEDIDSSMRVVERGFKIRSDRDLVSRELATTSFKQIWNQRMRWAQGWFQVSIEHMKMSYRSQELTFRQKLGIFHLLMWREVYPWLSQQLFPLVAFWAIQAGGIGRLDWTIPIFVATSIFTFSVGPLQAMFAYKLADDEIKQHKSWFWAYLFFNTLFYTEYKNLIARVAHVKQFMGESEWRVTPRSTGSDAS